MSCWEKQPLGSQQVVWKGRLIPEKTCTPEEICLRGGQVGPRGREALEVDHGHGCATWPRLCPGAGLCQLGDLFLSPFVFPQDPFKQ